MADILLGNVRGPIGPEGQPGATGETGQAATIEIGSVSTTAYGNPAQVVNSGTEEAAILDFTIPQGKPGEQTTRMGALTLDTITAQTATFPVPAVGETGSTVFGKIIKFFTDTASALASKLNVSDVINNLTSTATDKPLSANMGRQLNSNITPVAQDLTVISKFSTHNTCNIVQSAGVAKVYMDVTVGSSDIATWTTLAYWRSPIKVTGTGVCITPIFDVTGGSVYLTYASFATDGYSFAIGRTLTSGRRYMIGFTTVST